MLLYHKEKEISVGNTIDDPAGGPKPRPGLLQQVLAEIAEGDLDFRSPAEAIKSAEENLQKEDYFKAQYDVYDALGIIEGNTKNQAANAALLTKAKEVLESIGARSPATKLNLGDVLTYSKPIQIGRCLWICKKDDWPPLAAYQYQMDPSVGYAIIDLRSLCEVEGEYMGLKALRDGETVELAKIIDERISPESTEPNGDIRLRREGDTIKILSAQEVSNSVRKLLDSGMSTRIAIARKALQTQLGGELSEAERRQLLVDLAAIEAKLEETGDVPKD